MELFYDEPIKAKDEDLFQRDGFVNDFVQNLLNIPKGKNIIFSINGEWGSGKTSLLNMIKEELNRKIDEIKPDVYYKILNFAPWNIVDEKDIIVQFLRCLTAGFAPEKAKMILESKKYKLAANIFNCIPKINKAFKFVDEMLRKYSNSLLNGEKNLLESKEKICSKLNTIPFKFIVFIDDIDRLNNKEIRLIIQLVKAVFDFPNIIYILSYDKKIVAQALSNEQGENGFEYLEKIIQVSIDIPIIDKETINNCLVKKLNNLIDVRKNIFVDKTRWNSIYLKGYNEYFVTLRDLNRYINLISFKIDRYLKVIDCLDFLAIEAISLFEPDLLKLIWINRQFLCENMYVDDIEKNIKEFKREVEKVSNNYQLIQILFPVLRGKNSLNNCHNESLSERRFSGRICLIEYLEFYFSSKLGISFVSIEKCNEIINMANGKERVILIQKFTNRQFYSFINMLFGFFEEKKRISLYPEMVFDVIEAEQTFEELDIPFEATNGTKIFSIISKYFACIDLTSRLHFLKYLYSKNCNLHLLITLIYYLSAGTHVYSSSDDLTNDNELTKDNILDLHEILAKRVDEYLFSEDTFNDTKILEYIVFMDKLNNDDLMKWFTHIEEEGKTCQIISNCYIKRRITQILGPIESYYEYNYFDKAEKYFGEMKKEEIRKKLIDNEAKATIGEVLFLMPRKNQKDLSWYTIKDIKEYCLDNKIKLNLDDSFAEKSITFID